MLEDLIKRLRGWGAVYSDDTVSHCAKFNLCDIFDPLDD